MMNVEDVIGKEVVFTSYDDIAYGELYGGKTARIVSYYFEGNDEKQEGEYEIRFEDGIVIGVLSREVEFVEN